MTPTWGAASPSPGAALMVSIMSSDNRASEPSMSVTGAACCLRTGSPKIRIVYGGMGPEYLSGRQYWQADGTIGAEGWHHRCWGMAPSVLRDGTIGAGGW